MDLSASRASMDVARMKAKSVLEQQRIAAMYSGDFYRQILPVMYDASIIDQERFLALMAVRDIQTALSTRELIELAISWGITPNAQEFWKRHKSREELIRALQQKKSDMEMAAKLAEQQLVTSPADAERAARKQESKDGKKRRNSLVILGELYKGKEVLGDLFGSKGEYTEGIIYMARRIRMDTDSAVELAAKKKAATAMAHAARAKARARRASLPGQEERKVVEETLEDEEYLDEGSAAASGSAAGAGGAGGPGESPGSPSGPLAGVSSALSQPSSPRQKGSAGGSAGDFSLGGKKNGSIEEQGSGEDAGGRARSNSKGGFLNPINEGEEGDEEGNVGAYNEHSIATNSIEGEGSMEDGSPMLQDGGAIRIKEKDGKLHRIGSSRFPLAAHGGHEHHFSGVDGSSNEGSQVDQDGGHNKHLSPVQKMERLVAHRQQTMKDLNGVGGGAKSGSTVSGGRSVLSGGGSSLLDNHSSVVDVHAFIAKHTRADDDELDEENNGGGGGHLAFGGRSPIAGGPRSPAAFGRSSSALAFSSGPQGSPMSPGAGANAEGGSGSAEDYLPGKLSKLDLYYRPVNDAEKMVVVIPSSPTTGATGRMGGTQHHQDALDNFVGSGKRPLSGRGHGATNNTTTKSPTSPNGGAAATRTFISMSPAVSPDGHMSLEPLALRHRLGGRAGKLAREFSEKVKSELPTSDIHLVSPVTSGGEPIAIGGRSGTPLGGGNSVPRLGPVDFDGAPSHHSSQNHQQMSGSGFVMPEHAAAPLRSSPLKGGGQQSMRAGGHHYGGENHNQFDGGAGGSNTGEDDIDAAALAQGTSPLTKVLGEYIDLASRSRPQNAEGRDLQFDAVARQVDRIRTETHKAQTNQRLVETYGGGGGNSNGKLSPGKGSPTKGHR